MKEQDARRLLVKTGKTLLETKLVARTWGNVSCRIDEKSCIITPSGLDYMKTGEEDIVKMDIATGLWQGSRNPSGERGVHLAAYRIFSDAGAVIHTHQTYATAAGLSPDAGLEMADDERKKLGGTGVSEYGLSGSEELIDAVSDVMESGAHTVIMPHHGVLICGSDMTEAMDRAMLLERICRRNVCRFLPPEIGCGDVMENAENMADLKPFGKELISGKGDGGYTEVFGTPAAASWAETSLPLCAQIDDMAQMIGRKILAATDMAEAEEGLQRYGAVFIKDCGAAVRAEDPDDLEALKQLVNKACICALYTRATGTNAELSSTNTDRQHHIYISRYAPQKNKSRE